MRASADNHRGIELDGYCAQGPSVRLGLSDTVMQENIAGEPATLPPRAIFAVAPSEVDLLATQHGF